jgi:hypothetical protein
MQVIHLLVFWMLNAIQMSITAYQFSVESRVVADKILHHYDSAKYSAALNPGAQYPLRAMPSLLQLQKN